MNFNSVAICIGLLLQLGAIVFYAGKFSNKIDALTSRVTKSETDIERWQAETAQLADIDAKINLLTNEMERVRNRLDQFLDRRSES